MLLNRRPPRGQPYAHLEKRGLMSARRPPPAMDRSATREGSIKSGRLRVAPNLRPYHVAFLFSLLISRQDPPRIRSHGPRNHLAGGTSYRSVESRGRGL